MDVFRGDIYSLPYLNKFAIISIVSSTGGHTLQVAIL